MLMFILGLVSGLIFFAFYFMHKKIKKLEKDIDKLITDKIKKEYFNLNDKEKEISNTEKIKIILDNMKEEYFNLENEKLSDSEKAKIILYNMKEEYLNNKEKEVTNVK